MRTERKQLKLKDINFVYKFNFAAKSAYKFVKLKWLHTVLRNDNEPHLNGIKLKNLLLFDSLYALSTEWGLRGFTCSVQFIHFCPALLAAISKCLFLPFKGLECSFWFINLFARSHRSEGFGENKSFSHEQIISNIVICCELYQGRFFATLRPH